MRKTFNNQIILNSKPKSSLSLIFTEAFIFLIVLFCLLTSASLFGQTNLYEITEGQVGFKSDAPLELIKAQSKELKGILDLSENTFAFSIKINSFDGFNSPLQKEHFRENYLETNLYPKATFLGKIIERRNFEVDGYYTIRTKGKLTIHGIEQERIIKSTLIKKKKVSY